MFSSEGIECAIATQPGTGKNPARREDLENSGAPPRKPRLFLENAGGSGDCGPLPGMWCARLLLTRSDPYGKETAGYGGAVKN